MLHLPQHGGSPSCSSLDTLQQKGAEVFECACMFPLLRDYVHISHPHLNSSVSSL